MDQLKDIKIYFDEYEDNCGLRVSHIKWLIEQAEKVEKLEDAIDYVITAEPEHYHNIKNMLEDFKTVINFTLEGK